MCLVVSSQRRVLTILPQVALLGDLVLPPRPQAQPLGPVEEAEFRGVVVMVVVTVVVEHLLQRIQQPELRDRPRETSLLTLSLPSS